jgi:hypothetical protein
MFGTSVSDATRMRPNPRFEPKVFDVEEEAMLNSILRDD